MSRFLRFMKDEAGVATAGNVVWTMLILALGGTAVDVNNAHRMRAMMQATADAAALAAIQEMPKEPFVRLAAIQYTEKNMAVEDHGVMLDSADVVIGVYDHGEHAFTPLDEAIVGPTSPLPNAVEVILRRVQGNDNPLPAFFTRIIGFRSWNIEVRSVAIQDFPDCLDDGFVARGRIYSGSEDDYVDKLCIHGQLGVKIGSTNFFEEGVEVSMPDLATFEQGGDNTGIDDALLTRDYDPPLVDMIPTMFAKFALGLDMPDFIEYGPVSVGSLPSDPVPNTLYVVSGVVDFGSNVTISNIAVVRPFEIKTGSNVTLSNVLILSLDKVSLGSANIIGSSDFCDSGDGEVYIFSKGEYSAGSESGYSGVHVVGAGIVKLGSTLTSLKGISVQAGGDLFWGSAELFGGCGGPTHYLTPSGGVLVF